MCESVINYDEFTDTVKPIIKKGLIIGMQKIKDNLIELLSEDNDILNTSSEKLLVYDIIGMIDIEIDNVKNQKDVD